MADGRPAAEGTTLAAYAPQSPILADERPLALADAQLSPPSAAERLAADEHRACCKRAAAPAGFERDAGR